MNKPILITGIARSGISLIAGIVECCDAWGGQTSRTIKGDKYGSLENVEIRDMMVKPLLRGINADPTGQSPLPDIRVCHDIAKKLFKWWRKRVQSIIIKQGYRGNTMPIFFASPLSCLVWPIWAEAYPDARWVIVRRKDEEIIKSCMMTGYMRGHDSKEGWQGWIDVHKWRFAEMINAHLDTWQIWPQRMLKGDLTQLKQMIEQLELKWNKMSIQDYLAPILWREGVFEINR